MSEILFFSDIHIAQHKKSYERLKDCLKVLEWIFEVAKSRKIKNIVFAGDMFQDRQKIDIITYSLTFDILSKYCDGSFNLWLLIGNHDMWFHDKWDISSVMPFSALPNVTVINKVCTLNIDGYDIDFIPYVKEPITHIKEFEQKARSGRKVMVGHLALHGAELNVKYHSIADVILEHDGDMLKVSSELFRYWDQVFLGHYHGEQIIDNIEYIGSPLELTFGEAFQQKHIIIYDMASGKKEYIVNDFSPKHLIIDENEIDKHKLENNFVRLKVSVSNTELVNLKNKIAELSPTTFEIIQKPKTQVEHVVEDAKSILQKEDEMLDKYVEEVNPPELDKEILKEFGKKVCSMPIEV